MVLEGPDPPRHQSSPAGLRQTVPVGVGLLVLGVTAYAFLLVSARALGPERYTSLSALWALVFLAGPGFFLPVEQEVGRSLAGRRALGVGGGSLFRRAAVVGGALAVVLVAGVVVFNAPLLDDLFDDQRLLLVGLVLALVGFFVMHLARGLLAGTGRFHAYGLLLAVEGTIRLLGCAVLAVAGVATAGPYGVVLGGAPVVAALVGLQGREAVVERGPPAPLSVLTTSLGWLLAASLASQVLINAGPLAVKLLATEAEEAAAGRFLAGLVLARLPLFLFQAVQASLLPRLAELHAAGRHTDLRSGLLRVLLAVVAVVGVALAAAATVGPDLLRLLFGRGFRLNRADLVLLAAGSGAYLLALTLAQPLIALSAPARVACGWAAGVGAFVVTTATVDGLLARVETGFLVGSVVAAVTMGALLVPLLGQARSHGIEELVEVPRQLPPEP